MLEQQGIRCQHFFKIGGTGNVGIYILPQMPKISIFWSVKYYSDENLILANEGEGARNSMRLTSLLLLEKLKHMKKRLKMDWKFIKLSQCWHFNLSRNKWQHSLQSKHFETGIYNEMRESMIWLYRGSSLIITHFNSFQFEQGINKIYPSEQ